MKDLFHRALPDGTTLRFVVRDDVPELPVQDGYVKAGTVQVAERFWVDVFLRNGYKDGDVVIGPTGEGWTCSGGYEKGQLSL